MIFDLVIKNGRVITSETDSIVDLGVVGEKIAAIGADLSCEHIIDATGMLVIPGGVDAHVHLEMPAGTTRTSDDWYSGTRAALLGGTTTVIDFVEPEPDQTLLTALKQRQGEAKGRAWVDHTLHMTLTDATEVTLAEIQAVVDAGVTSFKVYTTFPRFGLDDNALIKVFEAVARVGGTVLVHSENDAIIQYSTERLRREDKLKPQFFPLSHPPQAEVEAIQRVIQLAKVTGVRLYIVHISTAEGAAAVARARAHGYQVFGETCPQYLLLDNTRFQNDDPMAVLGFVCNPPLRTKQDQESLWAALSNDVIKTVCTDHCAFNLHGQKNQGLESFLNIPPGLPGIEARLSLMYSFGVRTGKLTLNQWVSCCSTEAAKCFGLYPCKGELSIGSDADIVIFNPEKEVVLSTTDNEEINNLHEEVDYSPYEGFELRGWPSSVLLRGRLTNEHQSIRDQRPIGKFLRRREEDHKEVIRESLIG